MTLAEIKALNDSVIRQKTLANSISTDDVADRLDDLADFTVDSVAASGPFQTPLVSATNIKTINGSSVLGSGNISISAVAELPDTISVLDFGASTGNADNQPSIQAAINYALANNIANVYIPAGTYNIAKGILIMSLTANTQVNLNLYGAKKSTTQGAVETVLNLTGNTNFGIGVQLGKGVRISNLTIRGVNQLNYSVATAWNAASTYKTGGVRDNQYSPYAGIVIDPFHSSVISGDQYPGFASWYALVTTGGGSTDCSVIDCFIDGFVVARVLSPNGVTQNNESHVFFGNWISNCRESYVSCNSQERNVTITNDKIWNSVRTCYSTNTYGLLLGDAPFVQGSNIAGNVFEIFNIWASYSAYFIARDIHAESFYRLGSICVRSSIENCKFHIGNATELGIKTPAWHVKIYNRVVFNNCFIFNYNNVPNIPFRVYTISDLQYSEFIHYVDCSIALPTYSGHTSGVVGYDEYLSNGFSFRGTTNVYQLEGIIPDKPVMTGLNDYTEFWTGRFLLQAGSEIMYGVGFALGYINKRAIIHKVTSGLLKHSTYIGNGNVALTVSGTNGTFDLDDVGAATLKKTLQIGSMLYSNTIFTDQFGATFTGNHIGTVTNIVGTTVTVGFIVDGVVTGSVSLFCNLFIQRLKRPVHGTITSGSPIITNVPGHTFAAGDILEMAYEFSRGSYVLSVTSNTITMSSNAFYTSNNVDVSTYEYIETGYTRGDPIVSFTGAGDGTNIPCRKGTILQDISPLSAASRWICTKSGMFGTANAPEFIST